MARDSFNIFLVLRAVLEGLEPGEDVFSSGGVSNLVRGAVLEKEVVEEMVKEEGLNLIEDLEKMLVGGDVTADFEIVCKGEVIKCHRGILAARYF